MRFLIRLSNLRGFTPKDRKALTTAAYESVREMGADIGNLRVSPSAIEFDLLTDSKEVMERALARLEGEFGQAITVRELDIPAPASSPLSAIRDGLALFNEERYWESHESLELAWRTSTGEDREILQGIILLAASLVHLQKGEEEIAISVMKRASAKLPEDGVLFNIDLAELKRRVSSVLAGNRPIFFKITLVNRDVSQ